MCSRWCRRLHLIEMRDVMFFLRPLSFQVCLIVKPDEIKTNSKMFKKCRNDVCLFFSEMMRCSHDLQLIDSIDDRNSPAFNSENMSWRWWVCSRGAGLKRTFQQMIIKVASNLRRVWLTFFYSCFLAAGWGVVLFRRSFCRWIAQLYSATFLLWAHLSASTRLATL